MRSVLSTPSVTTIAAALLLRTVCAADQTATAPTILSEIDRAAIRAVVVANRYAISEVDGEYRARNPGQRWMTKFDGRGFTTIPDTRDWSWGLELAAYGRGAETECLVGLAVPVESGNRIAYLWDTHVSEWFVNDANGLEHGYTIEDRPPGDTGPLTFDLNVRGDLAARVRADGRDVDFVRDGTTVLGYAGLIVFDADGNELEARFTSGFGNRLRLTVDDAGARYPLTIDPVAQQAYLKASNTDAGDAFGYSIAISGDTIVVGANGEDSSASGINGNQADNGAADAGAVYVFVRNGSTWTQQAYLKASNTDAGDTFGDSVAISGDTIVVGARGEDSNASGVNGNQAFNGSINSGAAYVFVRNGTTWTQQAYLKASNPGQADKFGSAVAISGDTIVVSTPEEDSNAVGINGNQVNNMAVDSGAAYVFVRSGSTWSQQAYLKASNTEGGDLFGNAAAISGDTIVVGAVHEDSDADGVNGNQSNNGTQWAGAAYVFVRSGTTWTQQAYVKASNSAWDNLFGGSVAISGDTILVGSINEAGTSTGVNGDQFAGGLGGAGAAYVFVRNGTTWTQQAYLKASNTGQLDYFGGSVAVAGDRVAVGAFGEASSATGVNGDETDNLTYGSGAVYVFSRAGTTWTQQAYVKAATIDKQDFLGQALAITPNTLAVAARFEASGATGINGDATDDSLANSGAAYAFDLEACGTPAALAVYGTGKPGSLGLPFLYSTSNPALNSTADLNLAGGLPGASPVLLFVGFVPAALPFDGGTLLVNPAFVVTLPGLDGSGGFALPIPLGATGCGLHVYFQAMFVDPGAAGYHHTAQTNGLEWTIGV